MHFDQHRIDILSPTNTVIYYDQLGQALVIDDLAARAGCDAGARQMAADHLTMKTVDGC